MNDTCILNETMQRFKEKTSSPNILNKLSTSYVENKKCTNLPEIIEEKKNIEKETEFLPVKQKTSIFKRSLTKREDNTFELEQLNAKSNWDIFKIYITLLIDHSIYISVMSIITIYSLFADDIRCSFLKPTSDTIIDSFLVLSMCLYGIECLLSCIVKDDYLFSFYFFVDLISTFSLVFDILWIFNPYSTYEDYIQDKQGYFSNKSKLKGVKIADVSKTFQIARILKIIRIIRIIQAVKFYKLVLLKQQIQEGKKKKREQQQKELIQQEQTNNNPFTNLVRHKNTNISSSKFGLVKQKTISYTNYLILEYNNFIENKLSLFYVEDKKRPSEIANDKKFPEIRKQTTKSNFSIKRLPIKRAMTIMSKNNSKSIFPSESNISNMTNLNISNFNNIKEKEIEIPETLKINQKQAIAEDISKNVAEHITYDKIKQESLFSKKFGEKRTRTLIIIIMSLVIIVPFFDEEWLNSSNNSYISFSHYIDNFYEYYNTTHHSKGFNYIKQILLKNIDQATNEQFPIINATIMNEEFYTNQSLINHTFRVNELAYDLTENGYSLITYSIKTQSEYIGYCGLFRTFILILVILVINRIFENDAMTLVVNPLEIMIEIVERVAEDPINAKNVEQLQKGMKNLASKMENKTKNKKEQIEFESYEIRIIKSSIIKIASLLATGFGEAGHEMIQHNMNSNHELNPMLKGTKKIAIFGFCDIRNFSEINEALQQDTMVFVNEIADIVHSCVDNFGGAANKNIGDAFLLAWKLKDDDTYIDENGELKLNTESENARFMADQALLAFLSIIIRINKSEKILKYRKNKKILQKIKNFKVQMGFGLQIGWAIEGAIGSSYKVDASYLSPYVNMAARLEAATRQYGVSLILSGELYNLLADCLKKICRKIDTVTVKGSIKPLDLYTVDVNLNLKPEKTSEYELSLKQKRDENREKREEIIKGVKNEGSIGRLILQKTDFRELLRNKKSEYFYPLFDKGLEYYLDGDWINAFKKFEDCLFLVEKDGPTTNLITYIQGKNFIPPANFNRCRELTSKV